MVVPVTENVLFHANKQNSTRHQSMWHEDKNIRDKNLKRIQISLLTANIILLYSTKNICTHTQRSRPWAYVALEKNTKIQERTRRYSRHLAWLFWSWALHCAVICSKYRPIHKMYVGMGDWEGPWVIWAADFWNTFFTLLPWQPYVDKRESILTGKIITLTYSLLLAFCFDGLPELDRLLRLKVRDFISISSVSSQDNFFTMWQNAQGQLASRISSKL